MDKYDDQEAISLNTMMTTEIQETYATATTILNEGSFQLA